MEVKNNLSKTKYFLLSTLLASILMLSSIMYVQPTEFGIFNASSEYHALIQLYHNYGYFGRVDPRGAVDWIDNLVLVSETYHTMTLTTHGAIQRKLLLANQTDEGFMYFCVSNSSDEVDVDWVVLPDEITTNGLERRAATYTSTGDTTWNASVLFTLTSGNNSTKLYGVCHNASGNSLCLAEQQGEGNVKNLGTVGDTVNMTVQGEIET